MTCIPSDAVAACLLSHWSACHGARGVMVWLANAAFLTAVVLWPVAHVFCSTTDRTLKVVVVTVVPAVTLMAHSVPLGRLAAALLPGDIGTNGILAGAPRRNRLACACDRCD